MKTKQSFPAIPTEFTENFEINGIFLEKGWYGVKINEKGLEVMSGIETRYEEFEKCKAACDIHNKFNCGMSAIESAQLYIQQRGTSLVYIKS